MSIVRANTHPGMQILFCSLLPRAEVLFDMKYCFVFFFSYKCSFSEKIQIFLAVHRVFKFWGFFQ